MKSMKKFIFLMPFILFFIQSIAQKVANYSIGKGGTAEYEEFSFWVKANKRADIDYTYGKDWKNIKLVCLGKDVLNGDECFKVKFPNNKVLYILPKGKDLIVSDLDGKYKKYFSWHYEGPTNGGGTFCEPCAEDENEAMKLIKLYYMIK